MERVDILLVDDRPANLLALRAALEPLGENLIEAASGVAALALAAGRDFAVILLDVLMPGLDGFETAARLRATDSARNTPILFLTAAAMDEPSILRGYALGAVDYILKPLAPEFLRQKVAHHVDAYRRAHAMEAQLGSLRERHHVLVINDDPAGLGALLTALEPLGAALTGVESAAQALRTLMNHDVSLMLVDFHMPGMDGLELMTLVRQNERLQRMPMVFVTATVSASADIERAYTAGATEFIFLPIEPELLRARVQALLRQVAHERRLERQVTVIAQLNTRLDASQRELARANAALEEKVADQTAALSLAEETFRSLVEKLPAVVYEAALEDRSRILYVSPQIAALGPGAADWMADPTLWQTRVHPDDLGRAAAGYAAAVAAGIPCVSEYRLRTSAGDERWFLDQSTTVCNAAGRPVFQQGVMLDVTETKRSEVERDQLRAELAHAQKLESVGRLAGGVAHDFNNLLSVILGYSTLLLESLPDEAPQKADLHEVVAAAERAAEVTRQLLAFSRKQATELEPLALDAVIQDVHKLLVRLVGEDVTIDTDLAAGAGLVLSDRTHLTQILINLCVNARDAMPEGGPITISTRVTELDAPALTAQGLAPGRYLELRVADRGVGMSAETAAHVFEPFFTTKPAGYGTGLGLSTVYGVVKQHGGAISVQSAPGQGTVFSVLLPALPPEPLARAVSRAPVPKGSGATILVMEDDAALRGLVVLLLEHLGYRPLAPTSLRQCLELARSDQHIDLLLTDVVMPEANGRQVFEQVSAVRPGLGVLFMSGYTEDVLSSRGVADQGQHFISKPITGESLGRKLAELLGKNCA